MEWKNKYLKYKLKYTELKKTIEEKNIKNKNFFGGGYEMYPDEEEIFSQMYMDGITSGKWNKKTILLDSIETTKMQTETIKLIKYIINKKKIIPSKKHLEMALIFSVFCGYHLIVDELVVLGANPKISYNDWTLVDTAIDLYHYKTAKVLMKHGGLSKKYYSKEQLGTVINFSNDPDNYINQSENTKKIDNKIFLEFKEKLINGGKFDFENLSRNILKNKLKIMIKNN